MYYGNIKYNDIANGTGCRTSLFVSGCRNHCPHCFQPETWNFGFGEEFTEETKTAIANSLNHFYIQGLTILGGEPFEPENQPSILDLVTYIRKTHPDKNIWMYTGFVLSLKDGMPILTDASKTDEALRNRANTPILKDVLSNIDTLVDGRFEQKLKNIMLSFRGSSNQRIINVPATLAVKNIIVRDY